MNLYGNQNQEQQAPKTSEAIEKDKKWMKIIWILLAVLLVAGIGVYIAINQINKNRFKVVLNGKENKTISKGVFQESNDGTMYANVTELCKLLGYTYNGNSEYLKKYQTSDKKFYIESPGYEETASFTLGQDKFYKVVVKNGLGNGDNIKLSLTENQKQVFSLAHAVIKDNDDFYLSLEDAATAFNALISYDQTANKVSITSLDYLVQQYSAQYTNAYIVAPEKDDIKDNPMYFSNQKALLQGYLVTIDANKRVGVLNLNTDRNSINNTYKSVEYIENKNEFVVTTKDNKVGIRLAEGGDKIDPVYDSLKRIDDEVGLYLAEKANKFGILNDTGREIVPIEYDEIGIKADDFPKDNIENPYFLYNSCIPVKVNNRWKLMDRNGVVLANNENSNYQELGCVIKTKSEGESKNNVILIPQYNAIVVKDNDKYGLISCNGDVLIPTATDEIYSISSGNTINYYTNYTRDGYTTKYDVIDYLLNVAKIQMPDRLVEDEEEEEYEIDYNASNKTVQNTNTNTVTNEVVDNVANNAVTNTTTGGATQQNAFNEQFTKYVGIKVSGKNVKKLIDDVVKHNKNNINDITSVVNVLIDEGDDLPTDNGAANVQSIDYYTETILALKENIDDAKTYEVQCGYNAYGYVCVVGVNSNN